MIDDQNGFAVRPSPERADDADRHAFIVEASGVGTWEYHIGSDRMSWSAAMFEMWGRDPLLGVPGMAEWRALVHPEDYRDAHWDRELVRSAGGRTEQEFRVVHPGGAVRHLIARARMLFDDAGEPVGYMGVNIDITEQRRTEQRFRTLANAVPSFVWLADATGSTTYLNDRWFEYTGQEREDALPDGWLRAVHPDDMRLAAQLWGEAQAKVRPYEVECRYRRHDGVYRWHLARAEPALADSGSVVSWFGSTTDVHQQKEAEEKLRKLNDILEHRVEERTAERDRMWRASRDLMCIARTDGTLLSVNPAWERLLGWTEAELVGRVAAEIKHPDDEEATRAGLSQLAAGEPIDGFEDRYRHRDGSWRWISWSIEPAGELIYCAGRDITAEKQRAAELAAADAARREADALYRAYFENTAEALFVINVLDDGGFSIEDLNPAHQSSIGLPLAEVHGRRIDEVLPPELAGSVTAHYRAAIDTGAVHQYRDHFELLGRSTFWDTVLVPVRDEGGRIVRLIGSSRDLTGQVAAEEQLRQSQKMDAMGQLTGGVAHDFNNLLTPIIGSLDMLMRRGLGNERERRLIEGAMQSAERAKTLVQRLLAFARRQPLQAVAVNLPELVNGMAGLLDSTLGPTIDVRVDLAADLPPACADPNQLEMALLNLAVNARDAMPDGGAITISATRETVQAGDNAQVGQGEYIRLTVADTGLGMDSDTRARAVEPFFSTKGIGKGTGLGLSMVHGLAAQLGGWMTIESEPDQGTTVGIWLPISSGDPTGSSARTATKFKKDRGTALLVDDEDIVRMSTADGVSDLGYEVLEASSAQEALRLLQEGAAPDLIVTDHLMPGMSGVELVQEVRQHKVDLPVLIVSGYAEIDGIASDLPRLTKPFRNAELAEALAALKLSCLKPDVIAGI